MKLFANNYIRIDYLEEASVIETVWMPRSGELMKEGVKEEFLHFLKVIKEKKPASIIADTRYFGFKVDRELQNWIVLNYMSEIMESGVKMYAILVTEEYFPEVEKTAGKEESTEDFKVRYFTSHTEAFRWISGRERLLN